MRWATVALFLAVHVLTAADKPILYSAEVVEIHTPELRYCASPYKANLTQGRTLGVHIANYTPTYVREGFADALLYWSHTLHVSFVRDDSPSTCTFALIPYVYPDDDDSVTLARSEWIYDGEDVNQTSNFTGTISWNVFAPFSKKYLTRAAWRHVFIHELGHEFGLPHSEDQKSVMFWYTFCDGKDSDDLLYEEKSLVTRLHRSWSLIENIVEQTVDNTLSLW